MKLFTNLRSVQIFDPEGRLCFDAKCTALLVGPPDPDDNERARLLGFGDSANSLLFQYLLDDPTHTAEGFEKAPFLPYRNGVSPGLDRGLRLAFGDGAEVLLRARNMENLINIDDCEGLDIVDVWDQLEDRLLRRNDSLLVFF